MTRIFSMLHLQNSFIWDYFTVIVTDREQMSIAGIFNPISYFNLKLKELQSGDYSVFPVIIP
jgi:hypothetical protein